MDLFTLENPVFVTYAAAAAFAALKVMGQGCERARTVSLTGPAGSRNRREFYRSAAMRCQNFLQ